MHENYMYYLFVKDVTKIGLIFFEPMFVLEKTKEQHFLCQVSHNGFEIFGYCRDFECRSHVKIIFVNDLVQLSFFVLTLDWNIW